MLSRPTLADVATAAGVSLKTASRALNGEYGVAAATAERVFAAARSLGFRPNLSARSLASGRPTSAVGLIIADVADAFFAAVAGAVERSLEPRGLQLITASHHEDAARQRRIVRALVERRVDALLIAPAPGDASYLQPDIDHGLAVVGLDRPIEAISVDTVVADNRAGAAATVRCFVAEGHCRIAALGNDARLWTMQERFAGYRAALSEAGIREDTSLERIDVPDAEQARLAVERMLGLADPPTAILATQNVVGRGAILALLEAGAALPLAVFDEAADPRVLALRPRVISSDPFQLGATATSMALARMDGSTNRPQLVVLPTLFGWTPGVAGTVSLSAATSRERA
jgi:LacI family transcriptional regulator, galactose operon repressor